MQTAASTRLFRTKGHIAACVALIAAGILSTMDAWKDIYHIASRDEEASHVFLVPIVAAWLFWTRRARLRHCRPVGTWIGPLLVAAGWFAYSIGDANLYQSVWHGGAVLLVVGCLVTVAGADLLRQFLPVFILLIFLVPVPARVRQSVAIPLGEITAKITQVGLELMGVPVVRSGNVLSVNSIDVGIAEACNGLRMVYTLVLVCYAFAFGMPLRGYARAIVMIASPLSAIICNVIRLVPTVWLYGTHPGDFAVMFHDASAWIMLLVAFLLLIGLMKLLERAAVPMTRFKLAHD